jgi:phage terminase Nu1 subunit (DNA packaging protein)
VDLAKPVTSTKFGQLTGLSERRVQALKSAGILVAHSAGRGLDALASVRAYCSYLREQAAGRAAKEAGRLDLKQETAKLKVSQRKHYDLRNSVIEKTHVPLCQLQPAWGRVVGRSGPGYWLPRARSGSRSRIFLRTINRSLMTFCAMS